MIGPGTDIRSRLLRAAAILATGAISCLLTTTPTALAATPPTMPASVTASLQLSGEERQALVSWQASTDPDATVVGYTVEQQVSGGAAWSTLPQTATLSQVAPSLQPGSTYLFRVTAVNDVGDHSIASESVALEVPRVTLAATLSLRGNRGEVGGGKCGARTRPCERSSLADVTAVARATPATWSTSLPVTIERMHRKPGTDSFVSQPSISSSTDASGSLTVSLADLGVVASSGVTCLRVIVPEGATTLVTSSPWKCVRWRPPIVIGWAGDITLGSAAYGSAPGDGRIAFGGMLAQLRAPDLMVGNYEGTLSHGGRVRCSGDPGGCFIFQASPIMAAGLAYAGFDVMNLANNHCLDMGLDARGQTVQALRSQHIGITGLPGQITIRQVADTRVALVGFGFTPGTADLDNPSLVRALVRAADTRADVVVAVMHSGIEGPKGAHVPADDEDGRGRTRLFVRTAIDAGADVIVGSGPHVIRGIEQRKGRLAFYSTGNFTGWHNFAQGGPRSQSGLATVTLNPDGTVAAAHILGVNLVGPGLPTIDSTGAVIHRFTRLSRIDFGTHAPRISRTGDITLTSR